METARAASGMKCLRQPEREHGFETAQVGFGRIPASLNGTLYRIGPGRFHDANGRYTHWFDGEGLLTAIRLSDGNATVASRLVTPRGMDRSDYAKRGRLGRAPSGLARRFQAFFDHRAYVNVANTALMVWQNRLFALFEAGLPTEVDADTLQTLGETDFNVVTRAFGAHPQQHAPSNTLLNQGFNPPPYASVDYYALPPDAAPRRTHRVAISGRFPAHDFAVTRADIITILSPLFIDVWGIIRGRPIADCLRWQPEKGTDCIITPLGGGDSLTLNAEPILYSHTANAFDDGRVRVVHGVAAADASLVEWTARVHAGASDLSPRPSPGYLTEIRIDPTNGTVTIERLFETPFEFPCIDPRYANKQHSIIYGTAYKDDATAYSDFADSLVRFDVQAGRVSKLSFGPGQVVSEPVFIPDGEHEGEGWLLSVRYNAIADMSDLVIVRCAEDLNIVASVSLSQPLPMSLHGLWLPNETRTC